MSLSSITNLLKHFDQIADLVNHSAHCGRVLQFALASHFAKSQTTHRGAMGLLAANGAAHQLHLDGCLSCHHALPYAKSSSTVLPRLAATSAGVVETDNASRVARTMLYGLVVPMALGDDIGNAQNLEYSAHVAARQ